MTFITDGAFHVTVGEKPHRLMSISEYHRDEGVASLDSA